MDLPLSRTVAPHLTWLSEVGSTNTWLSQRVRDGMAGEVPDKTVVATDIQTAGRGRLDRQWVAPPGTSLALSVLRRPRSATAPLGLLPLIAGSALAAALRPLLPGRQINVKWPNDIHIDGRKVSGILCELTPEGSVIIGAGINLSVRADQLPVPTATSLSEQGATEYGQDVVMSAYLSELFAQTDDLLAHTPHGAVATAHDRTFERATERAIERARADSATLGNRVTVHLPGGKHLVGQAQDLDSGGRLLVLPDNSTEPLAVSAGDVIHLRS